MQKKLIKIINNLYIPIEIKDYLIRNIDIIDKCQLVEILNKYSNEAYIIEERKKQKLSEINKKIIKFNNHRLKQIDEKDCENILDKLNEI